MKKLFLLLAVCGLMVACGGEQKKDDKKADNQEQTDPKKQSGKKEKGGKKQDLTVAQLFDQMYDAIQNNDMARVIELAKLANSWGDELTPAQEKELEAYATQNMDKLMVVMEVMQNIDPSEYECCDDECCADEWADEDDWSDEDAEYAIEADWSDEGDDDDWSDEGDDDDWSDEDEW
jgi:hypothetical protein